MSLSLGEQEKSCSEKFLFQQNHKFKVGFEFDLDDLSAFGANS